MLCFKTVFHWLCGINYWVYWVGPNYWVLLGFFFYTVNPFSLPFRRFGDDRQSYRVLLGFLFFIHFIDLGRYILLGFYWVFFVFFFKYFQTFFIAFVETSTKLPGCTGFFFWFGLETVSIGFIGRFGTIDIVTEFYWFFFF